MSTDNSFGFFRVAAASPTVRPADVEYNTAQIAGLLERADADGVSLAVFPELSISGYSCGDLFGQSLLLSEAERGIGKLLRISRGLKCSFAVGVPIARSGRLYNCAAVISNGQLLGIVPKGEIFSAEQKRIFSPGKNADETITYAGRKVRFCHRMLFGIGEAAVGIEIGDELNAPLPASAAACDAGAHIIAQLAAWPEIAGEDSGKVRLLSQQSTLHKCTYVCASAGKGESTQDCVFAAASSIIENGRTLAKSALFPESGSLIEADTDVRLLEALRLRAGALTRTDAAGYTSTCAGDGAGTDFKSKLLRDPLDGSFTWGSPEELDSKAARILDIQVAALASRLEHVRCRTAVLGISGGLDSTLALLVSVLAADRLGWDRKQILAITMPGFGTSGRTFSNAMALMKALGVGIREISIAEAVSRHFEDIGHDPELHDTVYENSQARERTQILMDIANQENGIVVGTGDLSELALGWCTYNGDHMSNYCVNGGVPKTLVRYIVRLAAKKRFADVGGILLDIADTPISPELTPADGQGKIAQKTEDLVGPYELHDFFLWNLLQNTYSPAKIYFLACKAFSPDKAKEDARPAYGEKEILKWLNKFCIRFFSQQFKRSCMPEGPKVLPVSLSPRTDWMMPSDASSSAWLADLEKI